MTIRFIETVESSAPGYPFLPGQVISGIARLSPEMRQWIRDGRAELVREDAQSSATVDPAKERAVVRKGRR